MENRELRIEVLLEDVVRRRASDLHIQVGLPPMLRIDGALTPVAGRSAGGAACFRHSRPRPTAGADEG